ncbi:hypothetical protein HUT16_18625 [Kitasatospora sp. NA04385]|uniref:hypothetical protein n=1 Tax=Kitasatospora sp. NA04385 TaxID=2742135 RepID=UPI00158FE561|nr:hypothetical protein [Kitasatospora sp. NA04385]QKW20808.1 hypothetical protein HUT16_18625 [Kitasatospora sp. NA04385]
MSVHRPGELEALRALLDDWTSHRNFDLVVEIGEDRGLDHGRLCWDALERRPEPLVHGPAACRCRRGHRGPRDARQLHERLGVRVPAADAAEWMARTLGQSLVFRTFTSVAEARVLAEPLAELLGPDADWRANGHLAHPPPDGRGAGWWPVTVCTFDAALVGVGDGRTVVAVSTGED